MTIQRIYGGLGTLILASAAHAATVPYNNTFSTGSDALPATASASSWTVSGGNYINSFTAPKTGNVATLGTASDSFTGMNTATSLTVSTKFSYTALAATPSMSADTVGFGLFGSDGTFSGSYYLADYTVAGVNAGTLRIAAIGDTSGVTPTASVSLLDLPAGGFAANTTYELRVTGTRTGGSLNLTLGAYDSTGTQIGSSVSITDSSPLAGTNFGFRNRYNTTSAGGNVSVGFDNLTIAVPEPASAAALLGAALLLRRRRKA